jgi:hypothetical protein
MPVPLRDLGLDGSRRCIAAAIFKRMPKASLKEANSGRAGVRPARNDFTARKV